MRYGAAVRRLNGAEWDPANITGGPLLPLPSVQCRRSHIAGRGSSGLLLLEDEMDIFRRKRVAELEAQLSEEKEARENSDVAHARTKAHLRNALERIETLEASQRNAHMLDGLAREFAGKPMNSVDLEGIKSAFLKARTWIVERNGREGKA